MPHGVAKAMDRGMPIIWVEAEDRHHTAMLMQARLDAQRSRPMKLLLETPDGLKASPYADIINKAAKTMFRAAQELGFSPAARPRIHVMPALSGDADNPWSALQLIPGGLKG